MADKPVPTIVVMAKPAIPGRVKTRLTEVFSPAQAAAVHAAMLRCVLERVRIHLPGRRVLAMADWQADGGEMGLADGVIAAARKAGWRVVDQGPGDLGRRLAHVWAAVDQGPIAFLGVDSPDVPAPVLSGLWDALAGAEVGIGPVDDGGYWVLAARRRIERLVEGIDWGTASVYDQTVKAAAGEGVVWRRLAGWHDVDHPEDLAMLLQRLRQASEPALVRLLEQLNETGGAQR